MQFSQWFDGQLPIILKIKLWGDDGGGWGRRWWSFGELGIRQHRLILAVENQSPSRICQTCRRHTNATTAAAASAYPSMMLSSLLFSSLLFSSLLFSSPITIPTPCSRACFAHVYARLLSRHARLSGRQSLSHGLSTVNKGDLSAWIPKAG